MKPRTTCLVRLAVSMILLAGLAAAEDTVADNPAPPQAAPGYLYVEIADGVATVAARNAPVKALLEEIARQSGLVFVLYDPLDERITTELRRLPLPEVISRLLRHRNFALHHAYPVRLWVFAKRPGIGPGEIDDTDYAAAGGQEQDEVASLSRALRDADVRVRLKTISALAEIGSERAITALTTALHDSDSRVREEAVHALGEIGDTSAITLIERAFMDAEQDVQEAAVQAFADIGGERAAAALATALYDERASLREDAVYALGEIGGTTAIGLLQHALTDQDDAIREAAAEILAELSDRQ